MIDEINKEIEKESTLKKKKTVSKKAKKTVGSKLKKTAKKKVIKKEEPVVEIETKVFKEEPVSKPEPAKIIKPLSKKTFAGSKAGLFGLVILLAVIIGGGVVVSKQMSRKTDQATSGLRNEVNSEVSTLRQRLQAIADELAKQKENQEEKEEMLTYVNSDLGFSFKYPKKIGQIKEERLAVDEKNQNKTAHITFSDNPDIWLVAASEDFESDDKLIYNGGEKPICKDPLVIGEQGYCDQLLVGGQPTVEWVEAIGGDAVNNVVKTIQLQLKKSSFKGLTLNVSFGTPPITSRNLFAPTDEEAQQTAVQEFYRNILKKEGLSLIVKENLEIFESIVKTFGFVE